MSNVIVKLYWFRIRCKNIFQTPWNTNIYFLLSLKSHTSILYGTVKGHGMIDTHCYNAERKLSLELTVSKNATPPSVAATVSKPEVAL